MTIKKPKYKYKNLLKRHIRSLIGKSYVQRTRKWRLLIFETLLAFLLFLIAVAIASPVFLQPVEPEPRPTITKAEILRGLPKNARVGFAPAQQPYIHIMERVEELLNASFMMAPTETDLNNLLFEQVQATYTKYDTIIWILFKPKQDDVWHYTIRNTAQTRIHISGSEQSFSMSFLAVQCAVNSAILEHVSPTKPNYELSLASMPVSPLMDQGKVQRTIAIILFTFTMAFTIPVLETTALVVKETQSEFKRALRLRKVDFSSIYLGWVVYGYLTAIPMALLGSIIFTLLFRWIHILQCLFFVSSYISVMMPRALIIAMFHNKVMPACLWIGLITLVEVFFASLLVFHRYWGQHGPAGLIAHMIIPPLGFTHGLNEFALLRTGRDRGTLTVHSVPLIFTLIMWSIMAVVYFCILMLLQRTMGHGKALGGQVHWKAIIFKKEIDESKLSPLEMYTGHERDRLQSVDQLLAKAITFNNVSKSIMNVPMLKNVTFDVYRGEYTIFIGDSTQTETMETFRDLLTGLTYPDQGEINVLGQISEKGSSFFVQSQMMGYFQGTSFLIEELTVMEHIIFYTEISLRTDTSEEIVDFIQICKNRLFAECDLQGVVMTRVSKLCEYYRTQLCWAIALIMEPRIIVIPQISKESVHLNVLRDKIIRYKKYKTIVHMSYSSYKLIHADRIFLLHNKMLIFGGTPAYLFYKYGRDYKIQLMFNSMQVKHDIILEILEKLSQYGGSVKSHLGSQLAVMMPIYPSAMVSQLLNDLTKNSVKYGLTGVHVSLPDASAVVRKVKETSSSESLNNIITSWKTSITLKKVADKLPPERTKSRRFFRSQFKEVFWKYYTFYRYHTCHVILMLVSAIMVGTLIGISVSQVLLLAHTNKPEAHTLTVEAYGAKSILALRVENSTEALSIGNAYVMSEVKATEKEVKQIFYTALSPSQNIREYLVTRAIDSPQYYVFRYAYGMDVHVKNDTVMVTAIYSPMHMDEAAPARSLARVYMALMRHYTGTLGTSIVVTSDPLVLDLSSWVAVQSSFPRVTIQIFLILTTVHITFVPSHEYGLIKHTQISAANFSILRYWIMLALCDIAMAFFLVAIISFIVYAILYVVFAGGTFFSFYDIIAIPGLLVFFACAEIPEAYLFSLGNNPSFNAFLYVVVCIICSESTLTLKILYGAWQNYMLQFLALSPQFDVAMALYKITVIFLSNSECTLYDTTTFCTNNTLHRCCPKCGIMQDCFKRRNYLASDGINTELLAMVYSLVIFTVLLMLWECKVFQRIRIFVMSRWIYGDNKTEDIGLFTEVEEEKRNVSRKRNQIVRNIRATNMNPFGHYLLAENLSKMHKGKLKFKNLNFGLSKGEILALVESSSEQNRLSVSRVLCGLNLPTSGELWAMSKREASKQPQFYSRNVSLCSNLPTLPAWMTVPQALHLIAVLRGVSENTVRADVANLLEALELTAVRKTRVGNLEPKELLRVHFVAAILGAPPVVVMHEFAHLQQFNIQRSVYYILNSMKNNRHSFFLCSERVRSVLPIATRVLLMVDGRVRAIETVERDIQNTMKGYTIVVHLKNEIDVAPMFSQYFENFIINDTTEVLANVQVLDTEFNCAEVFAKMEQLQTENSQVYSYIVCMRPMEDVYHDILYTDYGDRFEPLPVICCKCRKATPKITPDHVDLEELKKFEKNYDIYSLKDLPWSVVFQK